MATGSVADEQSASSVTTLKEDREVREEGDMGAAGDLEAQQLPKLEEEKKPTVEDPYLVDWTGEDDPLRPINHSGKRKFGTMAMIAALAFLTYVLHTLLFSRD